MLGRDYSSDLNTFWTATGIFVDIMQRIAENESLLNANMDIVCELFKYFGKNCIPFCMKGFQDKSFYQVFAKPKDQGVALLAMFCCSQDKKESVLTNYLLNSDLKLYHLENAFRILEKNKFDSATQIFSHLTAFLALDYLNNRSDTQKLSFISRYIREKKLLNKTESLILNKMF